MAYIAIKTFFQVIWEFVKWLFTNKFTLLIVVITLLSGFTWLGGFYFYVKDIDKNWHEISKNNPSITDKTDAIVALTGGSERIRNAIYLLNKSYARQLFISGVNADVKIHEIFALHGFSEEIENNLTGRIILGYSAQDTYQNAGEIAEYVIKNRITSVRLVTSNYHIRRAVLELKNRLPDLKIIPHAVIPLNIRVDNFWQDKTSRELLLAEYNKLFLAQIRIILEKIGINI